MGTSFVKHKISRITSFMPSLVQASIIFCRYPQFVNSLKTLRRRASCLRCTYTQRHCRIRYFTGKYTRVSDGSYAQECASLHILELRVFLPKNSILLKTTDFLSEKRWGCPKTSVFGQFPY